MAINKDQLQKSIESAYGVSNQDSEKYLEKFVHFETLLPPLNKSSEIRNLDDSLPAYIKKLILLHEWDEKFGVDNLLILDLCNLFISLNPSLSLRTIERIFSLITIALVSSPTMFEQSRFKTKLLCAMAVTKVCMPTKIYKSWRRNGIHIKNSQGFFNDGEMEKVLPLYEGLKKYFEDSVNTKTEPLISIESMSEVCRVIDIYRPFDTVMQINATYPARTASGTLSCSQEN